MVTIAFQPPEREIGRESVCDRESERERAREREREREGEGGSFPESDNANVKI